MITIAVGVIALAAVLVLLWRGVREPTRQAPTERERVSKRWIDESRRSRDHDD